MRQRLSNYIRSGHSGLYIVSAEEHRVEAELKAVTAALGYGLCAWSTADGLVNTADGAVTPCGDPLEAMSAVAALADNTLVLLRDFHMFLQDGNPVLVRAVKNCLAEGKSHGRCVVVLGCRMAVPPELEKEFTVLDFSLPGKAELGVVLDGVCDCAKTRRLKADAREAALDAATGLTTVEAENAFALSIVESKAISPQIIYREKAQTVKKGGLLEFVDAQETLEGVGGLDLLKNWLIQRKNAFGPKAREYGLPSPKGLLIIGIPGTGKSLTAKATASVFQRPLLKLDVGRLFGGLVGQSEGNLRSVIQTAEAIAPSVLWIDEIEKGFNGSKSSGISDGGTASRVFGSFVSWMQERTAPVFVVATANDVTQLPPEFLRKGRWDEQFFVDLPNAEEREAIWRIQIAKYGRKPDRFDVVRLARETEGLTGSEIEQAFIDAMYAAFDSGKDPTDAVIAKVLEDLVPLSKLMSEQINALRKWAAGRARPATSHPGNTTPRKIAA
jgi:hypothetical protein